MPLKLDQADRRILIAVAIVLAVIVAGLALAPRTDQEYPSSYSVSSAGAKATFLLLEQLGYKPERWLESPTDLSERAADHTLMIIAVPTIPASPEERAALAKFIQDGGKLILIGQTAGFLLDREGMSPQVPRFAWKTYQWQGPSRFTRGAREIVMAPKVTWRDSKSQIHFSDGNDEVAVISYRQGKGEVIWWAAADPLTNSGITQKDNLQFVLNCVGDPGERVVLWDEYFHEGAKTLSKTANSGPVRWIGLQLGLFGVLLLVTYSRRHGPLWPLTERPRTVPLEFVETLGSLYGRVHAADVSVEVAYQRFRYLLKTRLGIDTRLSATDAATAIRERRGYLEPALEATLRDCESAIHDPAFGERSALELVEALYRYTEDLGLVEKREIENGSGSRNPTA